MNRLKEAYDLVYIDPPYKEEKNVELIEKLDQLSLINTNGMVVVESLAQQTFSRTDRNTIKTKEKCMVLPRSHIIESRNNNENSSLLWNV